MQGSERRSRQSCQLGVAIIQTWGYENMKQISVVLLFIQEWTDLVNIVQMELTHLWILAVRTKEGVESNVTPKIPKNSSYQVIIPKYHELRLKLCMDWWRPKDWYVILGNIKFKKFHCQQFLNFCKIQVHSCTHFTLKYSIMSHYYPDLLKK